MDISTGISIGIIVLLSLIGLGIFALFLVAALEGKIKPIDMPNLLERILLRFKK